MKFTQGPWRHEAEVIQQFNMRTGAPEVQTQHWVRSGKLAITLLRDVPGLDQHNAEADARLIAAAPELLEELKTLITVVEKGAETEDDRDLIVEFSKRLIAKIEGES